MALITLDVSDMKRTKRNFKSMQSNVTRATRRAMQRTLPVMKKVTVRDVKTNHYAKARPTAIKRRMRDIKQWFASRVDAMAVGVTFDKKPFSLIDFIKGSKKPRRQKGVKVARRRKLKAEITKGKVTVLAKSFIAKGKGGNYHVFRRNDQQKLVKRSEPQSLAHLVAKEKRISRLVLKAAVKRFQRQFVQALGFLQRTKA